MEATGRDAFLEQDLSSGRPEDAGDVTEAARAGTSALVSTVGYNVAV